MKKFVWSLFGFVFSILFLFISTFYLLSFDFKKNISKNDIIILGDSHTKNLKIPNSYNYSKNGASYVIHHNFVNIFKNQIKNKTVIVALSPNNLANYKQFRFNTAGFRDDWKKMINDEIDYYTFVNTKKFDKYNWRKRGFVNVQVNKNLFKSLFKRIFNFSNKSSENLHADLADENKFSKTIYKHFGDPKYIYEDEIEILFLNKLLLQLDSINCNVVFYNSPKTSYYKLHTPDKFNERLNMFYNNKKYSVLDYSDFFGSNLRVFKDADHLNNKGEGIMSDIIYKDLKELTFKP